MKKFLILVLTQIFLWGCSSGSSIQNPDGAWEMFRMSGIKLNKDRLMKGLPVFTFDVSENSFSGNAGCNQLASGIIVSDKEIKFGKIITTEMACPHMEVEEAVLKVISENTLHYEVRDTVLTLTSPDGTVMQFRPAGTE